jgi:hypothetical protein
MSNIANPEDQGGPGKSPTSPARPVWPGNGPSKTRQIQAIQTESSRIKVKKIQ